MTLKWYPLVINPERTCQILVLVWLLLGLSVPVVSKPTPPSQVVSLNLCADELLLALADADQIASVSWLSHDPKMTWDAPRAAAYPGNRGGVEEVLQYQPDLVISGRYTTVLTQNLLREFGIPVVQLDLPRNLNEAMQQISKVGAAVHQVQRAEDLVQRIQHAAASLRGSDTRVVVYYPNGFTTGNNSLIDSVLVTAGLTNVAAQRGLGDFTPLPLEQLVLSQPDYLILPEQQDTLPSLADQLLQHPALSAHFSGTRQIVIPTQAWSCGSSHLIKAFQLLDQLS